MCNLFHGTKKEDKGTMKKKLVLNISETRNKITQLDKLMEPGDILEVRRKGKPYAIIKLIQEEDPFERVLKLVNSLPEDNGESKHVAENYKNHLYKKERDK